MLSSLHSLMLPPVGTFDPRVCRGSPRPPQCHGFAGKAHGTWPVAVHECDLLEQKSTEHSRRRGEAHRVQSGGSRHRLPEPSPRRVTRKQQVMTTRVRSCHQGSPVEMEHPGCLLGSPRHPLPGTSPSPDTQKESRWSSMSRIVCANSSGTGPGALPKFRSQTPATSSPVRRPF